MKFLMLSLFIFIILVSGCSNEKPDIFGFDSMSLAKEEADIYLMGEDEYEKIITEALIEIEGCKYYVSGTIEYIQNSVVVAVVDYGNGGCDNIATKTIDGETVEFYLDRKKDSSDYDKIVIVPLVEIEGCEYIVEGVIEFYEDDILTASIDFSDGECDEWATKTWDGGSIEFSLNKVK